MAFPIWRGALPRALVLTLAALPAAAQCPAQAPAPPTPPLDPGAGLAAIPAIMARDWIGTPPADPYFSDDGRALYFEKRRPQTQIVVRPGGRPDRPRVGPARPDSAMHQVAPRRWRMASAMAVIISGVVPR